MADKKPYKAGTDVSSKLLNRTHQAATRSNQPPNSVRTPYGTFARPSGGGSLRRFELKDDLSEDNEATDAYLLNYDSDEDEYVADTDTEFEVYSFIGWTGKGRDAGPPVVDGTRGWCTLKDRRWEVVGGGGTLRRFELKDDLTADNTAATAYLLNYDSVDDEYEIDTDTEFDVYSFTGWTGTARDAGPPVVDDGTRGWCTLKDGRWEVVGGGGGSGIVLATLDGPLAAGSTADATMEVGGSATVEVNDWWLPTGESLAVDTKVGIAKIEGDWYVVCAWIEKTVVTDITFSEGVITVKKAKIVVFWAGADDAGTAINTSDFLTEDDMTSITVVTSVAVSGTTLTKDTRTAKVLDPGTPTTGTVYHTGTEC